MATREGKNLRRLIANLALTIDQVEAKSGVDRRTVLAILEGRRKPQPRTIHRLAEGLGVSTDEFFVEPAHLLFRQLDRQTNPIVEEVVESAPHLFADWTELDFDELLSRVGVGGPLTAEGVRAAAGDMNTKRELQEKLAVLLETGQGAMVRGVIELLYEQIVERPPET